MIVVTGAAGFIGSNLVKALNDMGRCDIIAVDDLSDGTQMFNLADCEIADYLDKDDFLAKINSYNIRINDKNILEICLGKGKYRYWTDK